MAADNVKLSVELVSKGFDKLNSSLDKVGASLTRVGTRVAAFGAAIAAPLALAAREAIKASENFSQVVVQLDKMDRSAGALTKLRDGLGDIASASGTDIANTTKAAFLALSSGVKNTDLEGFLRDTSKAAVGGFADLTDVVNVGTSALDSYRAQGLKLTDALDTMFMASKFGKLEFKDLAQSLGPLLPIAASAGVSFQEAAAGVAALTRAGFDTPTAVTSLRGALVQVYKPTTEATEAAEELGIKFDVATLKSKGLKTFMLEIAKATEGLPNREELMGKLFGDVRGLAAVLALTADNSRLMTEGLNAMAGSAGAVDDAFNTVKENDIGFVWRQLGTAWDTFVIKFGTEVTTVLKPAVEKVIAWLKELGGVGSSAIGALTGSTRVTAWGGALSNLGAIGGASGGGGEEAAGQAGGMAAWVAQIKSAVDLFIQLGQWTTAFIKEHEGLIASFLKWGAISAVVGPVVILLGQVVSSTTAIVSVLGTVLKTVVAITGPWGALAAAIGLVVYYWDDIKAVSGEWFASMGVDLNSLSVNWEVLWENVKFWAGEAFIGILEKATDLDSWFRKTFPEWSKMVDWEAQVLWDLGVTIADGLTIIFEGLWSWIKDLGAQIADLYNKAIGLVSFWKATPGSVQQSAALTGTPLPFANGGLVTRPTLALVGEAGPELITPLTGPNAGRGMTINVVSNAADPRLVAQEVARIFRQTARLSA
jgi:TP901 family phage tail tape measure protein